MYHVLNDSSNWLSSDRTPQTGLLHKSIDNCITSCRSNDVTTGFYCLLLK